MNNLIRGDALTHLKTLETDSIDTVITDPPYGYSFMNKDWDKAVISSDIWKEVLRVLKPGSFAAIMSSPRQDVLAKMIVNLQDAGFRTDFTSIYWTYASGFPKAANVSKLVDKRNGRNQDTYIPFSQYLKQQRKLKGLSQGQIDNILGTNTAYSWWEGRLSGIQLPTKLYYEQLKAILELDNRFDELIEREEAVREIIGKGAAGLGKNDKPAHEGGYKQDYNITKSVTEKAKELDGSYAGFQPKPAIEVILIVMKPLSEKTYVDQALVNGKGITWLDSVRIPFQDDKDMNNVTESFENFRDIPVAAAISTTYEYTERINKTIRNGESNNKGRFSANLLVSDSTLGNEYSRYFDLDKWFETTFPFIITPKASTSERNRGLDKWIHSKINDGRKTEIDNPFQRDETLRKNIHPTCKPIKLMSYLISLFTREGDIVLDPFCGSGTTCLAAKLLNRKWIGIDINQKYIDIANKRLSSIR